MKALQTLLPAFLATSRAATMPQGRFAKQAILDAPVHSTKPIGVGHFSEWSRATKKAFLQDWQAGRESEWIIVQGNEGGDMDSMTAALTWAYHLSHSTANTSHPVKAIALLQTAFHALDLRPENQLALANSQMTAGHEDLLAIDRLPEDPETLSKKLAGIILVDHGTPLRQWSKAKVVGIIDHHRDPGTAPKADPRIFEKAASCTTLVARQMLDKLEQLDEEYHMPHELLELILGAIAIDSGALKSDKTTTADVETSQRILARSNWRGEDLQVVMKELDDELTKAQKSIDDFGVRDLLRRDWKSDLVDTPSPRTPTVHLGFASIPYSLDSQIHKTEFGELFDWFATHAAWTANTGVDISICLNKFTKLNEDGKKEKIREIILTVRDDVRINQEQADSLFEVVKEGLENNDQGIELIPWHRNNELAPRQIVWQHKSGAGRKIIRPIVEDALEHWDMESKRA